MPRRRARWPLLLLALAAGCPSSCGEQLSFYLSESGRWRLDSSGLRTDPCDLPGTAGIQKDEALLVGTRWCPEFECVDEDCGGASRFNAACYATSVEGPGEADGACIDITGSGELLWRFVPSPCEVAGIHLPEGVRLRGAALDEVRGRLVSYLDTEGKDYLSPETGPFPADIFPPADAELLKVAADQPVHMAINLWASERRVAWAGKQNSLEVEVLRGKAPDIRLDERSTVFVQVPTGTEAALTLVVGPTRVPLGRVRGVAIDTLEQLEIVVAYQPLPGENSRVPWAARAVARDREGDLVYGARAEWEVLAGSFAFSPTDLYTEGANLDYTLLIDTELEDDETSWCFPTPATGARSYTGRIAADVAGLHAEVDLAWTYQAPSGEVDDIFEEALNRERPSPDCEGPGFDEPGACECTSDPRGAPPLALLALVALGTVRRRRRAPR